MLSVSASSVFHTELTILELTSKYRKHSIQTVIELGPPLSEFCTKISKFYAPTDPELKFHKVGIEN